MSQEQIELITIDALLEKVRAKKAQDCRLVQISATQLPGQIELTYSFDLNSQLSNLRLSLPGEEPHLPSISSIYLCAILYENEIHDLFGVQVDGIAIDFKGKFYKTAIKFPFATRQASLREQRGGPGRRRGTLRDDSPGNHGSENDMKTITIKRKIKMMSDPHFLILIVLIILIPISFNFYGTHCHSLRPATPGVAGAGPPRPRRRG